MDYAGERMKYENFEDWYNGVGDFGLRSERLESSKEELAAAWNAARLDDNENLVVGRAVIFLLSLTVLAVSVSTGSLWAILAGLIFSLPLMVACLISAKEEIEEGKNEDT